jgi:putative ABC transport system substrate-binding protein
MQRREFITFIGSTVAWPLAARAQPSAMPVIGALSAASPDQYPDITAAFERGLAEKGYVVGRNVTIERRWARGNYDRLPELAQELVRLDPALILVGGNVVALAVRRATSAISHSVQYRVRPREARAGKKASLIPEATPPAFL